MRLRCGYRADESATVTGATGDYQPRTGLHLMDELQPLEHVLGQCQISVHNLSCHRIPKWRILPRGQLGQYRCREFLSQNALKRLYTSDGTRATEHKHVFLATSAFCARLGQSDETDSGKGGGMNGLGGAW